MRYTSLCLLMCGCANFTVRPAEGPDTPGLHFFMPKPYLLMWWEREITVKSGAVMQSLVPRHQVLLLPDRSQRYAVTQHAFLAKGDFSFQLADGWRLESVNSLLDTTDVVRLLKDTGSRAIDRTLAQGFGTSVSVEQEIPPPVLFELVWQEQQAAYSFRPVALEGLALPPRTPPPGS